MTKDFYQLHLQFQNFMISKGYSVREREKLISPIFPTTFTMSGGPDLAYKFWQGDKSLFGNYIVNQPCVRHWDIELTGDRKHLSFFNMFVAHSIDGYSRKEIISHFYEFFTEYLHLDPRRFFASYFSGGNIKGTYFPPDEEMYEIWLSLNIDSSKIIPFGDEYGMEAFVANTIEPIGGPRAELFYDLRDTSEPIKSPQEFLKLDKEGQILEFCTHVLYNVEVKIEETNQKEPIFHFRKMDREAIAVGFGPQRVLTIIEGVNDVRDISILKNLKKCLIQTTNIPLEEDLKKEIMIVTDHIRGIIFLINDGVLELHGQKNRSRRYLFRKYFKHFKENFDKVILKLAIKDKYQVLECLTNESIEMFSILFPKFIQEKVLEIYDALEKEVKEIRTEKGQIQLKD
jgi:alanyl-tRNA synthetase